MSDAKRCCCCCAVSAAVACLCALPPQIKKRKKCVCGRVFARAGGWGGWHVLEGVHAQRRAEQRREAESVEDRTTVAPIRLCRTGCTISALWALTSAIAAARSGSVSPGRKNMGSAFAEAVAATVSVAVAVAVAVAALVVVKRVVASASFLWA